jgi:hypothetical protein
MNLSDLSVDGLTQLEARLAADLEMVKRVKALVVEYQKMGVRGVGFLGGSASASVLGISATNAPGTPPHSPTPIPQLKPAEERLTEALASTRPAGFILDDLWRATRSSYGNISKDTIKSWVKSMVRNGKVRVVETRAGRIGSVYAAVLPEASGTEGSAPVPSSAPPDSPSVTEARDTGVYQPEAVPTQTGLGVSESNPVA